MDNDKFISEWKIIHEKTMAHYVIPKVLHLLVLLILGNVILFWLYPHAVEKDKIEFIIELNAMTVIISTVGHVLRWFSREKRYRNITNKDFF